MKTQRQSNFELLRIILMVAIPLYHMMIYNNVIYSTYNQFTVVGLIFSSGSAIVADYAFMALSAYFLQESKDRPIISKFLTLFVQVLFIYLIKHFTLSDVLEFSKEDEFIRGFFYKGSWWFIYVYFIILLIYPLLNKMIFTMKKSYLLLICMILGVCFIYNGITNDVNLFHDIIAFLFTYFVVGYMRQNEFKTYFSIKNKSFYMIAIYVIMCTITFLISLYLKFPGNMYDESIVVDIIQHLIGKYSFLQFIMGIAIFLFFRSLKLKYNKWINNLAQNVFYVFLLHETVMAVFWYFDKLRPNGNELPYESMGDFLFWCVMYIGCCFIIAMFVRFVYEVIFRSFFAKMIALLCNTTFVQGIEKKYKQFL